MTIEQVISKVFNVDIDKVSNETSRYTIDQWDSMGHLTLIMALEEQFRVNISIADAIEMENVENIKNILRLYGVSD